MLHGEMESIGTASQSIRGKSSIPQGQGVPEGTLCSEKPKSSRRAVSQVEAPFSWTRSITYFKEALMSNLRTLNCPASACRHLSLCSVGQQWSSENNLLVGTQFGCA